MDNEQLQAEILKLRAENSNLQILNNDLRLDNQALSSQITLQDAKNYLIDPVHFKKGVYCLACGNFSKRYVYAFSHNMCRFLKVLYDIALVDPVRFVHVTEILDHNPNILMTRDFLQSAHYGLIEEETQINTAKKKRSGFWRITQKGRDFCDGKITVERYSIIYKKKCIGFSGSQVTLGDLEHEYFYYAELMAR